MTERWWKPSGLSALNVYPAKVFMEIPVPWAVLWLLHHMMRMPCYPDHWPDLLVEVLSVIMQVTYFKRTGGKRIFKMAPIHHHFELCGWSETRVVAVFAIVTAILCSCLSWIIVACVR